MKGIHQVILKLHKNGHFITADNREQISTFLKILEFSAKQYYERCSTMELSVKLTK